MIPLPDRLHALSPYLPHAGAMLLVAALGLGMGLMKTTSTAAVSSGQEQWALPDWKPFRADAQLKASANAKVWVEDPQAEQAAAAGLDSTAPGQWRFVGTVLEGDTLMAVIELPEAGKIQQVALGQNLPDGSTVTAIATGELIVTLEGDSRTLRLFENVPGEAKPAAPSRRRNRNTRR
jgi:hypothetical protein